MRTSPLARALLAIAAYPWCACARDSITIAVANYTGAPTRVIEFAVEVARRAFLSAGTHYLELLLMPRLLRPIDDAVPGSIHAAGFALPGIPRPRAWALYDSAELVSLRTSRPLYVVLGCIFVHETCHLLGLHHQPRGVMRPSLQPNDMDDTTRGRGFSVEEKKQLRAAAQHIAP